MENFENFYNDTDRELLAIAEYLKIMLLKLKAIGDFNEQKQENLDSISRMPKLVNDAAAIRYELWKHIPENDETLQKYRTTVECPKCNELRKVKIKGARKNPLFGWSLDLVKCTVCKMEFVNYLPNTFEERKKFNINLIDKLTTVGDDGETVAEKIGAGNDTGEIIKSIQDFIDAQTIVEKNIKTMKLKDEETIKAMEGLRDYFRTEKIKVDKYYKLDGLA